MSTSLLVANTKPHCCVWPDHNWWYIWLLLCIGWLVLLLLLNIPGCLLLRGLSPFSADDSPLDAPNDRGLAAAAAATADDDDAASPPPPKFIICNGAEDDPEFSILVVLKFLSSSRKFPTITWEDAIRSEICKNDLWSVFLFILHIHDAYKLRRVEDLRAKGYLYLRTCHEHSCNTTTKNLSIWPSQEHIQTTCSTSSFIVLQGKNGAWQRDDLKLALQKIRQTQSSV